MTRDRRASAAQPPAGPADPPDPIESIEPARPINPIGPAELLSAGRTGPAARTRGRQFGPWLARHAPRAHAVMTSLVERRAANRARQADDVTGRRQQLRSRRRAAGLGVAAGAAVIVAAVLMPSSPPGTGRQRQPAPGTTLIETQLRRMFSQSPSCASDAGQEVAPGRGAAVRYLPRVDVAGSPARGAPLSITESQVCMPAPQHAVWYRQDASGRVVSRLEVDGPMTADAAENVPYLRGTGSRTVRVGDGWGVLSRLTDDGRLDFIGPQDSVWTAFASGLTESQLITAVASLPLSGDRAKDARLDQARPPPGLTTRLPSYRGPAPSTPRQQLYALFGPKDAWISLGIEQLGALPEGATAGSRPVDINGRPGWVRGQQIPLTYAEGSAAVMKVGTEIQWEIADGVRAFYYGVLSEDQAIAWARATVAVAADDPRLPG